MTERQSPNPSSADAAELAESPAFDRSTRLIIAAILAGALVLLVGFGAGWFSRSSAAPAASEPTTLSAEAGFARDMQVHHQQAVQMSALARERSEDEDVRRLALDIATTQGQQAGQMFAWLESWGLPQAPAEPRMAWMALPPLDEASDHAHPAGHVPGGAMPGLATEEDLERLAAASGEAADRIYLQLMIEHHRGGVDMVEAVLARTNNPMVTALASSMVAAQQSEIDYMQDLLDA